MVVQNGKPLTGDDEKGRKPVQTSRTDRDNGCLNVSCLALARLCPKMLSGPAGRVLSMLE